MFVNNSGFLAKLKARRDRNRQELEALAALTGQTVAEVEADVTAPDPAPLPCGCVPGARLCEAAEKLWWAAFEAARDLDAATDEVIERRAQLEYNRALATYDAHFEQVVA